jgi:asparagine synthase (glutamine-hydrolysing)
MCGIAGILSFNAGSVSLEKLKSMTDSIAHRGPDGEGHWISESGNIGLGHRRLSIIDLSSAGHQPMHFLDRYSITFNGEIYNYLELKNELIEQGYNFQTNTDTEVLLMLYHLDGASCLSKLDGMWAFAIWDDEKKELFCARDRFGEKPFFYYKDNDGFHFASEMKALWAAGIPKRENKERFDAFANEGRQFDETRLNETFYQEIFCLEHSHWMNVKTDGKIEIQRYYDIDWQNQNFQGSFQEACDEFKRLFQISLTRRCRSDVAVGTSLSGGLDSSSIVCNMKDLIGSDHITPHTFSARFQGFKKDEEYFIEKVIEKTGVIPHYTWPSGEEMHKDFEKLCWHQEEPFGSASIYAQYRVQQLAKEHNVTVLIDGQGADEILAGYVFYYTSYLLSLHGKESKVNLGLEYERYLDFHTPHRGWKKKLIAWTSYYFWRHKWSNIKNGIYPMLNQLLYENTMQGGLQELLRYADRNSMAHSREVRLPFLNKDLVEFCFSLPDEYKLNSGWTKFVMRTAFDAVLPSEIAWRKEKVGFEPPQNEWLKAFGEMNSWRDIMIKAYRNG